MASRSLLQGAMQMWIFKYSIWGKTGEEETNFNICSSNVSLHAELHSRWKQN